MRRIALALVPLAFLVVGCADTSVPTESKDRPADHVQNFQRYEVGGGDGDTRVYRITNGTTPCIVVDSYESIAVSCDWSTE